MKKLLVLERPSYQPMYRVQSEPRLLRDAPETLEASWEAFDASSLSMYFSRGVHLLHKNIAQLQDLLQTYSENDEKELLFMVESLIQARRLIDEAGPHAF